MKALKTSSIAVGSLVSPRSLDGEWICPWDPILNKRRSRNAVKLQRNDIGLVLGLIKDPRIVSHNAWFVVLFVKNRTYITDVGYWDQMKNSVGFHNRWIVHR